MRRERDYFFRVENKIRLDRIQPTRRLRRRVR